MSIKYLNDYSLIYKKYENYAILSHLLLKSQKNWLSSDTRGNILGKFCKANFEKYLTVPSEVKYTNIKYALLYHDNRKMVDVANIFMGVFKTLLKTNLGKDLNHKEFET